MALENIMEIDKTLLTLQTVCETFRIPGKVAEYSLLTNGNINTTYHVRCVHKGDSKKYLAQRINVYVFRDPVSMMRNIDLVTTHIQKINEAEGITARRTRLHFYHTEEGHNYAYIPNSDGDLEFWRISNFIEDSTSFNTCDDPLILNMAGKAFGKFAVQLSDFDATQLVETIPHFHDTRMRLNNFFKHVEEDPFGRCSQVENEIKIIRENYAFACRLNEMVDRKEVIFHVTHNDTKTNNVLFDKDTFEPLVVIDLDTVMPGLAAFDFGDTIRFAASTAAEDEPDTSKVGLDLVKFRAFTEGYIGAAAKILSPAELDTMALGAATITLELATRFLDDYITGDKYFKTLYPDHNLVRTRCQLALFQDMMKHFDEMNDIVHEVASLEK